MQKKIHLVFFVLLAVAGQLCSQTSDSEKGNQILKAMSDKLAAAQSFSVTTKEFHDRLKPNGQRVEINVTRDVVLKRPNGFWTKYKGDRDFEFWYDGKQLTGISPAKKIYVQHEMPPTIDQTLDRLFQRLNLDLPMSDVLYSSPYEAFMDDETKGGYKGKENIDSVSCSHLSYTSPLVDWQLWINDESSLPQQLELKYKTEKGNSIYKINFSNWNLKPEVKANLFQSVIPDGYVKIPILERVANSQQTQTFNNPK